MLYIAPEPELEPELVEPEVEVAPEPEDAPGPVVEPEVASGPGVAPQPGPEVPRVRLRRGASEGDRAARGRGSAWSRFLEGRDANPVEDPSIVLTGVRPFEPARDFAGNPACSICGGTRATLADGHYCGACDAMSPGDEEQVRHALKVTPSPKPDRKPHAKPRAKGKGAAAGKRRRGKKQAPVEPGDLRGGLG
jgi:hypothetical protein